MPKERHRPADVMVKGVKRRIYITPKRTKAAQNHVGILALSAANRQNWNPKTTAPIRAAIEFYLPIPPSWPKWKQNAAARGEYYPTAVPDLDNLEKTTLDGMNRAVFRDDAQVVSVQKAKFYSREPRTVVTLTELIQCTRPSTP